MLSAAVSERVTDANPILRFGRNYRSRRIGVFFQVAMQDAETGKVDLSGAKLDDPEQMTMVQICDEREERYPVAHDPARQVVQTIHFGYMEFSSQLGKFQRLRSFQIPSGISPGSSSAMDAGSGARFARMLPVICPRT